MKFSMRLLALASTASAFTVVPNSESRSFSLQPLFISSYSSASSKSSFIDVPEVAAVLPTDNVVSYLKEPEAVEARSSVDGTCLVSGLVQDKERQTTDQFLFDLINHEESAFEFTKIVAAVPDPVWSKKRLLSRSARYTGLLDKLDFVTTEGSTSLPSVSQLEGVKSWVAYVDRDHLQTLSTVARIAAQAPSLVNVAVLLVNANELTAESSTAALSELKSTGKTYTVVAVGTMDEETPEGQDAYMFEPFGTPEGVLPESATFSRQESYRMITELLQLACGENVALSFAPLYNPNVTEAKLIRGLRQAGYARPQEIDHMIRDGPKNFREYIENWKENNPDAAKGYTTDAWWEAEIYQESRRRSAEREVEKTKQELDYRQQEVDAIALEWAKREYFRQSMAGTVPDGTTEDDFVKSVWDRALFEGDLKYRQVKGETIGDVDEELATFKAKQERKQEAMLERAKQELKDVLQDPSIDDKKDDE